MKPLLYAALAVMIVNLPAWGASSAQAQRSALEAVTGEVIVRFKPGATLLRQHALGPGADAALVRGALAQRATALGQRHGRRFDSGQAVGDRTQVIRASGLSAAALAAVLAADPDVEFASPNGRQRALVAPNDPFYLQGPPLGSGGGGPLSGQWYLRAPTATVVSGIDVEAAWLRTRGNASIVVAVLDTGVRPEHPDLAGRLLPGYDFVSNPAVANDGGGRDADPSDPGDWVSAADIATAPFTDCTASASSWHGTATASLMGAATDNGIGMAGTAPGVKILPVRVLGKCFGTDADIQAGMLWAAGIHVDGVPDNPNPAKVINLSLGGAASCSASYQSVVDRITAAGTIIVAAAGNSAGAAVGTPGNCRGVIAVLALRHAGTKVGFSDLGSEIAIAAPGGNCVNTTSGAPCLYPMLAATNTGTEGPLASTWSDSYRISVGTSFAAPLVAGTVGLMLSAQPAMTPAQVRSRLQASARPFPSSGADNGPDDPAAVPQCVAPATNVQQFQCYCSTALCGAGMLDAGAAVAAAAGAVPRIDVAPATPVAGTLLTLSAAASLPPLAGTIASYEWSIVDGGGIAGAFSSATNAATASLTPSGAGSFTVQLVLSDSAGQRASARQTVTVAAAPAPQSAPIDPVTEVGGSGGGGGALGWGWLAGLALLAFSARRRP